MKLGKHKKTNLIFIFVALCVVILACISTSLAIYLNQASKKGVVSTTGTDIRFSSNILNQYPDNSLESNRLNKSYTLNYNNKTTEQMYFDLEIANTTEKSRKFFNTKQINYDLVIDFILQDSNNFEAGKYPTISIGNNAPTQITSLHTSITNQVLSISTQAVINTYRITIPESLMGKTTIKISAIPHSDSKEATKRTMLYREILPVIQDTENQNGFYCLGNFDKSTGDALSLVAYSYKITINNGIGNIKLSWKGDYLKINDSFLSDNNLTPISTGGDHGEVCVQMEVNSTIKKNYELFFTKEESFESEILPQINNTLSTDGGWAIIENIVTLELED